MWLLFLFSFRIFAENPVLEPKKVESIANDETDLTDCKILAKAIGLTDKKFPLGDIKSIKALVTWRTSRCEKPPTGEGLVTQLCDAELAFGKGIFFWEKKTKEGKLKQGFFVCD